MRRAQIIAVSVGSKRTAVSLHSFNAKELSIGTSTHIKTPAKSTLSPFHRQRPHDKHRHKQKREGMLHKKHSSRVFLKNLCVAVDLSGQWLFCCGFDDASFVQFNLQTLGVETEFREHSDIVSCLALDENERKNKLVVVTGSLDKSVIVWKGQNRQKQHLRSKSVNYHANGGKQGLSLSVLFRKTHDAPVNCVDVSVEKGVVTVATQSGSLYMYSSSKGELLWSYTLESSTAIAMCRVSGVFGTVLCYACDFEKNAAMLFLFSCNGELLAQHEVAENDKYHALRFGKSGNSACCGGLNKSLVLYELPSFSIKMALGADDQVVRHVSTDKEEKYLFCGLDNGHVLLYSYPQSAQTETPKPAHRKSLYAVKSSPFQLK